MIWFEDAEQFRSFAASFAEQSYLIEEHVKGRNRVEGYCNHCRSPSTFTSHWKPANEWTDLRGCFVCESCHLSARLRLLLDAARSLKVLTSARALVFERVTFFFKVLQNLYPNIEGVEYIGAELESGSVQQLRELTVTHQDMESTSYEDASFELVLHSDVLEHVPDYIKGLTECYRILEEQGILLFSCPIYNYHEHIICARRTADGAIEHLLPPAFHGNPISDEGSLVFVKHGLNILEDLKAIGFSKVEIGLEFNPLSHLYSNNNPYYNEGHMWPLVIRAQK